MSASRDPLSSYRAKRDAARTPEPEGRREGRNAPASALRFAVNKHAARRLHWDLRLEHEGVLWSWAVPAGPSRDPAEKRLAVHTEDHPLEYAEFEDVIPEGNYGAGAMILWDQGTYTPLHPMEEGLAAGKLLFELRGHKLRGVWTLVKMRKAEEDAWLLIKERDSMAVAGPDTFPEDSVVSGLTVEELASGDDSAEPTRRELDRLQAPRRLLDPGTTQLMLAETAREPFSRAGWVFEFKYDGYRTLAFREDDDVRLLSRRGNDLSPAFPELVRALARLPYRRFLLDGEIVVEDETGLPSFQRLQQRAQLRRSIDVARGELTLPAKLWFFDLLGFEDRDVRPLPLTTRKALLRPLLPSVGTLRFSEHVEEHGIALYQQAAQVALEGVIGKRANSPYRSGRSGDWLKVRSQQTDDFVIVGWTAPKGGRTGFGALHLGRFEGGVLRYAGQVGTGFNDRLLRDLHQRLAAASLPEPPCEGAPSGRGHAWTRPDLVCEVRYLERTDDDLLRQPVFLRLREDKAPSEALGARKTTEDDDLADGAESGTGGGGGAKTATGGSSRAAGVGGTAGGDSSGEGAAEAGRGTVGDVGAEPADAARRTARGTKSKTVGDTRTGRARDVSATAARAEAPRAARKQADSSGGTRRTRQKIADRVPGNDANMDRGAIEDRVVEQSAGRGGARGGRKQSRIARSPVRASNAGVDATGEPRATDARVPAGVPPTEAPDDQPQAATPGRPARRVVAFSNLDKVFWPEDGYTKGDLIAYYQTISPWMLPYLRDRPIVLTRFPDGIHGKSFFQKDAPSFAPAWLRTVAVMEEEGERAPSYFVCDDVETLLYLANSGSIPLHVWSSRVSEPEKPDWSILDLDPKDAPFDHVVEVALAARELCEEIGLPLYAKTSGSSGIHLLVPLGARLVHEHARALGELLARVLVRRLPRIATITRQVERRGGKVYVDYLQNGRGKLLVAPYCVRPLPGAPVSTPLQWREIEPGLDIRRFTIRSVPRRVKAMKEDPLAPVLTEAPDLLSALDALQSRI